MVPPMSDDPAAKHPPANLTRLRVIRHLCTFIGGITLVFGVGIKDNGSPVAALVGVALLTVAYICLRRERAAGRS
jgi:hypothetical protein